MTRGPPPHAPFYGRAESVLRPSRPGLDLNLQPPAGTAPYAALQQPAQCGRRQRGRVRSVRCEVVVGRSGYCKCRGDDRSYRARRVRRRLGSRRRIDAFSSALLDPAHAPASRARRVTTRGVRRRRGKVGRKETGGDAGFDGRDGAKRAQARGGGRETNWGAVRIGRWIKKSTLLRFAV